MGMAAPRTRWTADRLRALPADGRRFEIIDGELFVTPSPGFRHQYAVLALAARLRAYLAAHPVGVVLIAPADVEFGNETVVEPDVFVVPLVDGRPPEDSRSAGRPLLVIEVLSPSTERIDRERKRALYQAHAVPEYWIVNPDARVFERWRPGDARAELLAERVVWQPAGADEGLEIDLAEYWREVLLR